MFNGWVERFDGTNELSGAATRILWSSVISASRTGRPPHTSQIQRELSDNTSSQCFHCQLCFPPEEEQEPKLYLRRLEGFGFGLGWVRNVKCFCHCGLAWEGPDRSYGWEKTGVCVFAVRDNRAFHVGKHRPFHRPTGKKTPTSSNLFTQT